MSQDILQENLNTVLQFYEHLEQQAKNHPAAIHEHIWPGALFGRLWRALISESADSAAPPSRYAIWASNVQETLFNIQTDIGNGDMASAQAKLNMVINVMGAFSDTQLLIGAVKGSDSFAHHVPLEYMRSMIEADRAGLCTVSKEEIVTSLRQNFKRAHPGYRGRIGLPRDIGFSITDRILLVHVDNPLANMQTDAAAFEAWILILKAWLPEIDQVLLDYKVPEDFATSTDSDPQYLAGSSRGHYNRFLFRLHGFAELFSDWFAIADDKKREVDAFVEWFRKGPSLLNHPLAEAKSVIETEKMERQIESWLAFEDGKPLLCERLNLDPNTVFNQLPVGVFHETISARQTIFTRGASAIDLWGIDHDQETLHLIELKCGDNMGVGVLSEMLFYVQIMRQACGDPNGCIDFGLWHNTADQRGIDLLRGRQFQRFALHHMGERFHPLLQEKVYQLLNRGLSAWHVTVDQIRYDYASKKIVATSI